MRLRDRVAIVTGAARGIGRAIAEGFAREGAAVVVSDRALGADGAETVRAIERAGGRVRMVESDVADLAAHAALIATALDEFGRLDVLVNNAGLEIREPFLEARAESWEQMLAVNLKGPYFLSQRAARVMSGSGGGKIVNVGSIQDAGPTNQLSIYAISKSGLGMLTKALALELAPHRINVNAVAPGAIRTAMTRGFLARKEQAAHLAARIPWGRIGEPEDVVGAAVFLASAEADYVTGATLHVDGGLQLRR